MALEFVSTESLEILSKMLDLLRGKTGEPLRHGDERRIFAENQGVVMEMIYNDINIAANAKMLRFATGEVLDAIGERLDVVRIAAQPATTNLVFTLSAAIASQVYIPAGTRVTPDGAIFFNTDRGITIKPGDTQGAVSATSLGVGEMYNGIVPGEISTIVDPVGYVQSVENVTETAGGNDVESDDHFRDRIQISPGKLSTAGPEESYIYWAKTADADIMDVKVTSPKPVHVLITVLMTGGAIPSQAILDKVYDTCSPKDRRPLTDFLQIQAPTQVPYSVDVEYYTTAADEAVVVQAVEGAGGAIDQFIEWQRAKLGRDLNEDKLTQLMMKAGCVRVDINAPLDTVIDDQSVAVFSGTRTLAHHITDW